MTCAPTFNSNFSEFGYEFSLNFPEISALKKALLFLTLFSSELLIKWALLLCVVKVIYPSSLFGEKLGLKFFFRIFADSSDNLSFLTSFKILINASFF